MFDYKGFGENVLTFKTEENNIQNKPVTVVANDTVAVSGDGDKFCGIGISARNGVATVQMCGYAVLSYTGDMTVGVCRISATADGKVKPDENGISVKVINVDADKKLAGFIF